jgi:hypothetical protein
MQASLCKCSAALRPNLMERGFEDGALSLTVDLHKESGPDTKDVRPAKAST